MLPHMYHHDFLFFNLSIPLIIAILHEGQGQQVHTHTARVRVVQRVVQEAQRVQIRQH